jgi:homogentisate 1,2-dioxygenase
MPFYLCAGSVPNKRHIRFRRPDGGLYAEELFSVKGFAGVHSLLYHGNPPTAVLAITPWNRPEIAFVPNDPLRNRHWETIESPARFAPLRIARRAHDLEDERYFLSWLAD